MANNRSRKQPSSARSVKQELRKHANEAKAQFFPRFFKTGKGEYGEGDKFLGVVVPDQRKIARRFKDISQKEIDKLLDDPYHECRLTGLLILVSQFENAKSVAERESIVGYYLSRVDAVNNWDLVDATAHKILGCWLYDQGETELLYELAETDHLWQQRIAVVATYWFIKNGELNETIRLSKKLLNHPHDIIHKAVGWMLREVGKQDETVLLRFLNRHHKQMPRTMLRYAIEKLEPKQRQKFLK